MGRCFCVFVFVCLHSGAGSCRAAEERSGRAAAERHDVARRCGIHSCCGLRAAWCALVKSRVDHAALRWRALQNRRAAERRVQPDFRLGTVPPQPAPLVLHALSKWVRSRERSQQSQARCPLAEAAIAVALAYVSDLRGAATYGHGAQRSLLQTGTHGACAIAGPCLRPVRAAPHSMARPCRRRRRDRDRRVALELLGELHRRVVRARPRYGVRPSRVRSSA